MLLLKRCCTSSRKKKEKKKSQLPVSLFQKRSWKIYENWEESSKNYSESWKSVADWEAWNTFTSFIPTAPRFSNSVLPDSQETCSDDHDPVLTFSLLLILLIIRLFWTNLATTWAPRFLAHGLHPIWLAQLKVRAQLKPWLFPVCTVPLLSKRGVAVGTTSRLPYLEDEFPSYTSPRWCHH